MLAQVAQGLLPQLETGPCGRRERREVCQFGALSPSGQREGRVGADDEDELHPRKLLAQLAQRVHGVGDAGALYLQGAHGEGGVASHGGGHHGQPHLAGGHKTILLEGGTARGHEQHRIEVRSLEGLLGTGEMPQVRGVEGAPHDTQPHERARPCPLRQRVHGAVHRP